MSERKARRDRALLGRGREPRVGTPLAFRYVPQVFGRTKADPSPHWHDSGRVLARLARRRAITGES